KHINQWQHWSTEVIPSLLPLFRTHLHKTDNLRCPACPRSTMDDQYWCSCGSDQHVLQITCVFFDRIAHISICCCSCSTAACQLITMGLFPCAPVTPSLTVDLRVLQFVKTLFVRQTPNVTAWCKAVEVFLAGRGYTFLCRQGLFHAVWNHSGMILMVMVFRTI
ncbi:hypothetical protein BDN67DRAFT_916712, partial [Paxillus ammoniavirescens]